MAASHIQKIQNVKALMIQITRKEACCGCEACVQICPKACISLKEDEEGFWYPHVDVSKCVDCKLCEQACPVLHQEKPARPLHIYAAKNKNEEIRLNSSSGGIFTLLAEDVLRQGGVVFGARFNQEWNVVHAYVQREEELADFRGSKYVQSHVGICFTQVKTFLDSGREVLFSGTPCQVAGLKNYLRKPYSNLFTVDLVCHGVPSPEVWRRYLQEAVCRVYGIKKKNVINLGEYISDISFRAKDKGWKKYNIKIIFRNGKVEMMPFFENSYMNVFLSDLSLRPSCYACPTKLHHVQSDITLADFWGVNEIKPDIDDDKGCGLILINCEEKLDFLYKMNCQLLQQQLERVVEYNPCILSTVNEPANRDFFWAVYYYKKDFHTAYMATVSKSVILRVIRKIYRCL